jgi:hypothetical protein
MGVASSCVCCKPVAEGGAGVGLRLLLRKGLLLQINQAKTGEARGWDPGHAANGVRLRQLRDGL